MVLAPDIQPCSVAAQFPLGIEVLCEGDAWRVLVSLHKNPSSLNFIVLSVLRSCKFVVCWFPSNWMVHAWAVDPLVFWRQEFQSFLSLQVESPDDVAVLPEGAAWPGMVMSSHKHSRSLLVIMLLVCQPLVAACFLVTVVHWKFPLHSRGGKTVEHLVK